MIIDGKMLSVRLKDEMKAEVPALVARYGRKPCLAMIIVGDDPASRSYVRGKAKASEYVGVDSQLVDLPASITEKELIEEVNRLNADDGVDGILVQLPLPAHINKGNVLAAISLAKDVDGFHPANISALWLGNPCTHPCTPRGILEMIRTTGVIPDGKRAVVVGRSNIVGKPTAKLLMDAGATVTICHSHTQNLSEVTREADILVVAVGKAGLITGDMIKPGALVIDVGINRTEDGKLAGDVDFESAKDVAGYISPVPGGVGPMTITMLLKNTIERFRARNGETI